MLDAGAGEQKYRKYCEHLRYTSQDFCQYNGLNGDGRGIDLGLWNTDMIDIVSDIVRIPVSDASFDNVMCTEVLEHIPQPEAAVREFGRIVKQGGRLLLTAPFQSYTHMAPYHYCDGFNIYWYKYWLPKYGFLIKEIKAYGNLFLKLEQDLCYFEDLCLKSGYGLSEKEEEAIRKIKKILRKKSNEEIGGLSDVSCYGYLCEAIKL